MPKNVLPETVKSLRLGKFKGASNTQVRVYLLGDTLIDTGPPNQWRVLKNFIEENVPQRILLTHHHEDHAGNAARIAKLTGASVHIAGGAKNPLAEGFPIHPYQRVVWGLPEKFPAEELPAEIFTSNGHKLLPIKTPGHSPDHTAFLEPDRKWLFSGDLYVGAKPYLLRSDENLDSEMATLKKLLDLDFEGLFCSHMGFVANGRERIEAKLAYLKNLVQRVEELATEGMSLKKIANKLLKKDTLTALITLGHFSRKNMILACLQLIEKRKTN